MVSKQGKEAACGGAQQIVKYLMRFLFVQLSFAVLTENELFGENCEK